MMHTKSLIIFSLLVILLTACTASTPAPTIQITPLSFSTPCPVCQVPTPAPTETCNIPTEKACLPTAAPLSADQAVIDLASQVIQAIKDQDFTLLATYIHPGMGLRISPYAFVRQSDLVFSADQVKNILTDSKAYTWGQYSGSGADINLSFMEYYSKFIYDADYANAPQLSLDHRLGVSTSTDNSLEFYSGARLVEYYFPGFDASLEGMDWLSLRLVFMQDSGTWYLVGIIHDQWTT